MSESEKKKIALVVDSYDWCFYNIASQIKKHLSYKYNIEIIVMDNINNIYLLMLYLKQFDLAHFFWRGHLLWLDKFDNEEFINAYGFSYDYFVTNVLNKVKITTSVYDHLYLERGLKNTQKILSFVKAYTVSSNILYDIYKKRKGIFPPKSVITDGVDLGIFFPTHNKYENIEKRKIIFGWVGNSAWNENEEDYKGFNTIIKPAIEELKKEGYNIDSMYADSLNRRIPFNEMNDYYNSIDVLLCASKAEGTPNPILEAMATGTIVITTNVGIVSKALGKLQKEYILTYRSKNCLKEKIKELLNNKKDYNRIREENLNQIKNWSWEIKAKDFDNFFTDIIEGRKEK